MKDIKSSVDSAIQLGGLVDESSILRVGISTTSDLNQVSHIIFLVFKINRWRKEDILVANLSQLAATLASKSKTYSGAGLEEGDQILCNFISQ